MNFKQKIVSTLICSLIIFLLGCESFKPKTNEKESVYFFSDGIVTNQVKNGVVVTLNATLIEPVCVNDGYVVLLKVEFINLCNRNIFIKAENMVSVMAALWKEDEFSTIYFEESNNGMKLSNEKYVCLSNKNSWFNKQLAICDNGSLLFKKRIKIINRPHLSSPSYLLISINSDFWRIGGSNDKCYPIGKILKVAVKKVAET